MATIELPTFSGSEIRAALHDDAARARFDIGEERARRRLNAWIEKRGCDCPRCNSNEDFRAIYGRPA